MLDTVKNDLVNGLDLKALGCVAESVEKDPARGKIAFAVTTRWTGQTRSETVVDGYSVAGEHIGRTHKILADEPCELLGGDSAPNPQELLMAAFNACITVGYVAGASLQGITLESLEIRTRGELDLRGFLGLSDTVAPGYEEIEYEVRNQGRRHARAVRGDPPDRAQDLAQLFQHQPTDPREGDAQRPVNSTAPNRRNTMFRMMLAAAALASASAASATKSTVIMDVPPIAHVPYGDLNLHSTAGRTELVDRIHSAATSVCVENNIQVLEIKLPQLKCYRMAVASGIQQMDAIADR